MQYNVEVSHPSARFAECLKPFVVLGGIDLTASEAVREYIFGAASLTHLWDVV